MANDSPLRLGEMGDGCRIALRAAGHDLLRYESALVSAGVTGCDYALRSAFIHVQDALASFEQAQQFAAGQLASKLHDALPGYAAIDKEETA